MFVVLMNVDKTLLSGKSIVVCLDCFLTTGNEAFTRGALLCCKAEYLKIHLTKEVKQSLDTLYSVIQSYVRNLDATPSTYEHY